MKRYKEGGGSDSPHIKIKEQSLPAHKNKAWFVGGKKRQFWFGGWGGKKPTKLGPPKTR